MKYIVLILFILVGYSSFPQIRVNEELDSLAQTLGMEFVYGDKFPVVNPYGSYGSSSVFNFFEVGI